MLEALQILGALLVLAAFTAAQLGRARQDDLAYLLVNLVGSGILAGLAAVGSQWGFLLLEGVWALVSAWGLLRRARPARGSS